MKRTNILFQRSLSVILSAAMVLTSLSLSGFVSTEEAKADSSYKLVWSDEFDGNSLDTSTWTYEIGTGTGGWGNNELQYYTDRTDNVSVSDGNLHITAKKEDYNGSQYTSGRIISYKKAEFTYGRVEARIAVPQVQGLWPAFWMLGSDYTTNTWPTCGEIDIMEAVNREGISYGTVHWGVNGANHAEYGQNTAVNNMADYHVYAVEWTDSYIKWFVDDQQYNVIDITANDLEEFHHDFFIIFNLAVGGQWPGYTIDDSALPTSMDIDYVRVYQLSEDAVAGNADVPQNLTYTQNGNSSVISWDRVNGATSYKVYRASSRYSSYSLAGTTEGTSYTDNAKGYYYKVAAVTSEGESLKSEATSYEIAVFGENVYVFEPTDDMTAVQAVIDEVYSQQYTNQFGEERVALLFKPGNYDGVTANVGFYTQVEGLGKLPSDTVLSGLNVGADWMYSDEAGFNATCNFWRSAENLTINDGACWAVAQATSLRRMQINGALFVDFYGQGWASGGFMADCITTTSTCAYSQQQWFSRNCDMTSWSGGVWNAVLVGCDDNLALDYSEDIQIENSNWDITSYPFITVADETPVIRETPYLYVENDEYYVYVPSVMNDTDGVSWKNGNTPGTSYKLSDSFYIAQADKDNSASMNAALAAGKSLILTPGVYEVDTALQVNYANQSVIGLGYATLRPTQGNACIETADVDGLTITGLLFDAGPQYSYSLLRVGTENSNRNHSANPTLLSDLFFRVGGVTSGIAQAETCIIINSCDVIGDNFWVWRADHGDGVSWAGGNQTKNGVVINGDFVSMYGLFVEHFHEYQTVWNGNYGTLYFYQSELPYDVPNQPAWMAGNTKGYASFKVADDVTDFRAYGMGIYSYNRDAEVYLESGMEVPDAPGVSVNDLCIVCLNGHPGINHVINGVRDGVSNAGDRAQIIYYCNGEYSAANYINGYDFSDAAYNTYVERTVIEDSLPDPEPDPEPQPTEEITGITASASSAMQSAALAVDGNTGSRWESEHGVDPQWITLDLGASYQVSAVEIAWEAACAKTYEIQVSSDNQNWTTAAAVTDGAGGETRTIGFNAAECRYVRIYGTSRNLNYGYSIWEVKVYGSAASGNDSGTNPGTNPGTDPDPTTVKVSENKNVTASSEENGGTAAANAVDGNEGSRWSSAWNDDEWITVDLGDTYSISSVKLIWEAAYGESYSIQVSADGDNWNTVYTEQASDGGIDEISLTNADGRYVKVQGIKRATNYGYSLYELEVYGSKGTASGGSGDETGSGNETGSGSETGNGDGSGTGTTTHLENIAQSAIATASSSIQSAANAIDGKENSRWESEFADPQWITLDLGASYTIKEVTIDWETAAAKTYEIQVSQDGKNWTTAYTVTDGTSGASLEASFSAAGRYVRIYGTSRTTGYGYSIYEIGVYAEVSDSYYSSVNLTKGKSASASTGNASMAIDGNNDTRWESAHGSDEEWIMVDLGSSYRLDSVKITWEGAYAAAYTIDVSADGVNWQTVYTQNAGEGGTEEIALNNITGRYVRMNGIRRGTVYGYSIWELEVYGGAA